RFWRERIGNFRWAHPPDRILEGEGPAARWFAGGRINVAENALDRWVDAGRGDALALAWESEAVDGARRPREVRRFTFRELRDEVARVAGALRDLGVRAGDRVTVYLPIVPELPIAMLACARLGAVHNVIFAGFPEQALLDRIEDSGSRVVVTADGGWRAGKAMPLKPIVDAAARRSRFVERVLVLRRTGEEVPFTPGRDRWWHEAVPAAAPAAPEPVASDAPLFLMYTSGSTGKPKGIAHGTAGYLVHTALTAEHAFDLRPGDVSWCTADPAWITGHSYTVYGPLLAGAATVLYEGVLALPDWDRAWDVVERHRPAVLYTTPTLIRAWLRQGDAGPARRDLSSLRLLASVGEPINPSVWRWFRDVVGAGRLPVVDTWWQTEAGAAMIFPFPYATPSKPGAATLPFFGVEPAIADAEGRLLDGEASGQLVIRRPWPGMLQGIWGDDRRYHDTYWKDVPGAFVTGDAARRDADGYLWIQGRTDDVVKVNGHRLGTAEIEGAVVAHPGVSESAVVGVPDERSGEAVLVFAVLAPGQEAGAEVERGIVRSIEEKVGKLARPREVRFLPALPKNRSGKILRRLLREWAITGVVSGDVTTLDDATALPPPR
ncbi:MAG: acetate--CoA ligase, partial [Anaeromyxobacteraceae bacterium]